MQRKISLAPHEYYHVYNRGNNKQEIFFDQKDYERFLWLLYVSNSKKRFVMRDLEKSDPFLFERGETLVDIGVYCLMPNHFHILIREKTDGGISLFMQKLSTAYSMYINKKYGRTGGLFEGKFRARHADTDKYFKYLFAYMHLNPVKLIQGDWKEVGIKNKIFTQKYLDRYLYSSYLEYANDTYRPASKILNKKIFPEYFESKSDFDSFIHDWLTYKELDLTLHRSDLGKLK